MHLDNADLPADYVWSWTELGRVPEILESSDINRVSSYREAGQLWVATAEQLAIRVQSAVIPHESNVLLNPTHAGYYSLQWPSRLRFNSIHGSPI